MSRGCFPAPDSQPAPVSTRQPSTANDKEEYREAVELLERALTLQARALAQSPDNQLYQTYSANHHCSLAMALAGLGRVEEAASAVRRSLALNHVDTFYDCATVLARCAEHAANEGNATDAGKSEEYAAQALDLLEKVIEQGQPKAKQVRTAPELDFLRDRPEFQELLRRLDDS